MDERTVSKKAFDAVIFDLDGVVTRTASLHARAWKEVFDEFLARYSRDPRAEQVRRLRQEIDLHDLERRFDLKARGFTRTDGLLPIERAYLSAIRLARVVV